MEYRDTTQTIYANTELIVTVGNGTVNSGGNSLDFDGTSIVQGNSSVS